MDDKKRDPALPGEDNRKADLPESKPEKKDAGEEYCPSIFDKPDYSSQKPPKKGGLSKRTVSVLVAVLLCVCLAAGAFTARHFWGGTDNVESSSVDTASEQNYIFDYSYYLSSFDNTDSLALGGIQTVEVQNPSLRYVITPSKTTMMQVNSTTLEEEEAETIEWNISSVPGQDIEGVVFSTSYVSFVMTNALKIPYSSIYAEDGSAQIPQGGMTYYEECGLDDAKVRVKVNFSDGSAITIVVGDSAPTGDERFLCIEAAPGKDPTLAGTPTEDPRIYRVANSDMRFFEEELHYFVDKQLIELLQHETTYDEAGNEISDKYFVSGELAYFDALSVTGRNFSQPLVFQNCDVNEPSRDSIYTMVKPYEQNVDVDAMDALLAPLAKGFDADECLVVKATASDLHNYGLDNPACVVSYRVKNVDYTIRIGNKVQESGDSSSDGTYYTVMVGSNPSIFRVSADSVSFAERDAAGYASDMVYSCDIAKIKTMTVAIDGKTTEFALRHSEGENSGSDEMTVTTGSKTVDDQTFRKMYVNLLSMTSFEHVTDGKDAASPYVKITFTYDDYSRVDTLRFSPYTDRRYFMSLNGSGSTVVLSTAVDAFTESFDAVMATAK